MPEDGPREMWVRIGAPTVRSGRRTSDFSPVSRPVYQTHFYSPFGAITVNAAVVELLARGPEDFADDVEPEWWRW